MKSRTKHILEKDSLEQLVKEAFPGEHIGEIKELTEGMFNSAYLVTGSGQMQEGAVLKIGPSPDTKVLTYEKEIMKAEVEVYELLRNHPVPTPRVIAAGSFSGSEYFFMTCMEGELWKNADKNKIGQSRPRLMKELGRYNGVIHGITGEWFGYLKEDRRYRFDTWYEAFYGMMNDILEDGRKDGHKLPYEEIIKAVVRSRTALDRVKAPQLVDFDMWAGNVFVKPEGNGLTVSGIIDFERCFYGDPYADFTSAHGLFDDIEKEPEFRQGYGETVGAGPHAGEPERIRMDLYRLYMTVILCVETYRYDRAYAAGMQLYCRNLIKDLLRKLG